MKRAPVGGGQQWQCPLSTQSGHGLPMTEVFLLQHAHVFEDGGENVKIIGVYSTKALAISAMNRHKALPGFSDAPNLASPDSDEGFHISPYLLDEDAGWGEGFITV